MYKYPFFVLVAIVIALSFMVVNTVNHLELKNQKLTEENKVLRGNVASQHLTNDSLKVMLNDFSQTLTAYQQLLKEVGILVQRQCPEMFKHHKEHGPILRRPQSLPDPEDIPKPAPKVDI